VRGDFWASQALIQKVVAAVLGGTPIGIWNVAANCSCESFSARRMTLGHPGHASPFLIPPLAENQDQPLPRRAVQLRSSHRRNPSRSCVCTVLFMAALPWFRQSGRDDPNPRAALCVDDGKEVVLDHAEQDIATLAVILTPLLTHHGERVIEG
jgi:hypothetical protein